MSQDDRALQLRFAAISDVGRVRKDNQDSGYAGPWLLTVCDGVGGAARGDLASSTAVQQLRNLDVAPQPEHTTEEMIGQVAGALHRAHDRIAELVDHDPSLSSTSTTATVALFDGTQLAIGHVGDSRAYLFRQQGLTQLTHDHTFVQTLIDDGRITETEARYHPHRNLILKAIDGQRETEPDLFIVPLQAGDRLMLCSDGVCGVLDDGRIADVLTGGSADYAAVELVRASLEAGSSDNVTCIVADVVEAGEADDGNDEGNDGDETHAEPQLVGAAAELRRRRLFKGHRSGDTGELEPVPGDSDGLDGLPDGAIPDDPLDPEALRYAPRAPSRFLWLRRVLALAVLVGVVWVAAAGAWSWAQRQYFVGVHGDDVTIFRGLNTSFVGIDLSKPYVKTDLSVDTLATYDARQVKQGVTQSSLDDAKHYIASLASRVGTVAGAE
ncbi:protein phosphatase [Nocardioides terrae]|uniref:Protein phosphatase n=1 Tax=Nocardioides terrae TaxID=574651 RepID=A0A1I1N205_9ACTN|nr:protein phosphatase 2C domain-containing protein [Nocardioides terrae]SFC91667.1 protein phosphatase [Nocardioides terrae]